jgi:hypothetical protein
MVVFGFAHLKINLGRIMQTFTDKTVKFQHHHPAFFIS